MDDQDRADDPTRQTEKVHTPGATAMPDGREVRVAVVGDLHFDGSARGALRGLFAAAQREADILAIVGDLTTHGEPQQASAFVEELEGIEMPTVAVLGNHDHEAGEADAVCQILRKRGIRVLNGENVVIEGVGFAGVTPDVVFHGHAHIGSPEGRTPSGIPVFNVAATLLERHTGKPFRVWTARAPERRRRDG